MEPINFSTVQGIGLCSQGMLHLSPQEAFTCALESGAVLVDLRPDYETNFRVFAGVDVIYLQKAEFYEKFRTLPRERPLILADAIGLWSKEAIRMLQAAGYNNLANLIGGIIDWERSGLPVKKDKNYELSGQCSCKLKPRIGGNPLKKRNDGGIKQ